MCGPTYSDRNLLAAPTPDKQPTTRCSQATPAASVSLIFEPESSNLQLKLFGCVDKHLAISWAHARCGQPVGQIDNGLPFRWHGPWLER